MSRYQTSFQVGKPICSRSDMTSKQMKGPKGSFSFVSEDLSKVRTMQLPIKAPWFKGLAKVSGVSKRFQYPIQNTYTTMSLLIFL